MSERPSELSRESGWIFIALAAAITIPALMLRMGLLGGEPDPDAAAVSEIVIKTVAFGIAILGAAFLLSWGAEVAQLDISQALAIAFLAFIAVLPEYAVDLTFAWKAGAQDAGQIVRGCEAEPCRQLAIANMTGANRLLIGLGWSAVVLIWWRRSGQNEVRLTERRRTDIGFLLIATLWALTIPIRGNLTLLDLGVLFTMFVAYIWRAAREEAEHPELIGPPVVIAALSKARRRTVTIIMFVFAAAVILVSAEPFAHGLTDVGKRYGISSFLLVQWLAPLASEAPEMIIAIMFVVRAKPDAGLGTLVSSKVNQWTLLIATIPLVYTISRGGIHAMALDGRQVEEVLLTAAQSLFAIAVLANLTINKWEAVMLLFLFGTQFAFESTAIRYGFSGAYLALTVGIFLSQAQSRHGLRAALKEAFVPPWR